MTTRNRVAAVCLGLFVGFVLGVTSAGSGALIAVGLILIFQLLPQRVVGTDVFHAAILLWAAAIAHIVAGNVDFGLAGNILIGSIPGVWVGSHLSVRVPTGDAADDARARPARLRPRAAGEGGRGIPGAVLAAFPVGVAILIGSVTLRDRRRAAAAEQHSAGRG